MSVAEIAVVVPAKNEAALLGRCLAALRSAAEAVARQRSVRATVTVVLDDCSDGSRRIVDAAPDVRPLEVAHSNVGLSRAAGINAALAVSRVPPERTWVACTDADSVVPRDWLLRQLELADAGCQLVLGTVMPDPEEVSHAVLQRWLDGHVLGPGHPHVHGANLGFLAAAYRAVGGFRPLAAHEDADLVGRLKDLGVAWAAADTFRVLTSGRLLSRIPHGFAGYLQKLDVG